MPLPSLSDLAATTVRRARGATLGAVETTANLVGSIAHGSPRNLVEAAKDFVAPAPRVLAEPPRGSHLKPVKGDADDPVLGSARVATGDRVAWGEDKAARYGNLWWASIAGRRVVQVTGGDATRQVLINKDREFSSDGWVQIIGKFFGGGLMLMSFDEHLDHRRIMQSAFTPTRLKGYLEGMDARIVADLDTWADGEHLMYPKLKDLGLRIATDVFLGMELERSRRRQVLKGFHAQARAGLAKVRMDLPFTLWGDGRNGYDRVTRMFRAEIPKKRANPGDDLFSAMVHAEGSDGARFTDDEIVDHMNFLWFAAHDTTNMAMTMMTWALAAHPEWQERARAEVLALPEGPLTWEGLQSLEALRLVMYEVMRLWPPVPAALRQATKDTVIDGYWIPRGTFLQVYPVGTHRMDEYWEKPDVFDPTRFEPPREEHKQHSHCYLPFGGGVHKCIGFVFAELEAKAVLARLLRTHDLSCPDGYVPEIVWSALPEPGDHLPLTVTRRA